jgi:multimeric flavodoxin WrbA
MRVLGLTCGRKMGNSEILVREALSEAERHGADIEIIRLGDLTIKPCTGCESCVINVEKGGEGLCIQKNDHMPFLLEKLATADGIILGVPSYMCMPPGLLGLIMNRTLGCGKSFRERVTSKPKIGAVIAIGGASGVNLVLPLANFNLYRMVRKRIKIVDQMLVTDVPRPGQILLHEDHLVRSRKIGNNVVEALKVPYEKVKFNGRDHESCPLCHNNLLKLSGKYVECPMCNIKGTVETKGGRVKVVFTTEELKKSRDTESADRNHDNAVEKGHTEYNNRKFEINEMLKKYRVLKRTAPPPLSK